MKKNILHIFEDPRYGGPHNQFINIYNASKGKSFNHQILSSNIESSFFFKKLKKQKINFKKIKINFLSRNLNLLFKYLIYFFLDIYRIFVFLKKNKDISIVCLTNGSYSFKSLIASKLANKKIIWHIHDAKSDMITKCVIFVLSPLCNYIIFASATSKKYYSNVVNIKKSCILQTAINFNNLNYKKNQKKSFTVGMVSNFNQNKDIIFFLEIVKVINKIDKKINFKICGNVWKNQQSYYLRCKDFIKKNTLERLVIEKKVSNMNNFYNKIDLLLLTSKSESSPTVIWEAMYMKKIVISTKVGDVQKFLKKNDTGFVLSKSVFKFSKKILELKTKKQLKEKIGQNANTASRKYFNIKDYYKKYEKVLNIVDKQ